MEMGDRIVIPLLVACLISVLIFGGLVFRKIENDELSVALLDCFPSSSIPNVTGRRMFDFDGSLFNKQYWFNIA